MTWRKKTQQIPDYAAKTKATPRALLADKPVGAGTADAEIDWPAQRRISEQQGQINGLREENERLREALQQDAPLLHAYVHPDIAFDECDSVRCSKRRALLAGKPVGAGDERILWNQLSSQAESHGDHLCVSLGTIERVLLDTEAERHG